MKSSNSEEVFRSQLNNSPSKSQYSFPKARRFGSQPVHDNPNICYNTLSTLDKRAAGIGYGKKYDFTKEKQQTPDPAKYSSEAGLNLIRPRPIAYTFRASRNTCSKQYIPGHFLSDPAVPGPGAYKFKVKFGEESSKFSFRGTKSDLNSTQKVFGHIDVPGPGSYDLSIEKNIGKSFLSNHKSSPTTIIAPNSFARFPKRKDLGFPGPGSYLVSSEFLKGNCVESKYVYCGARKFNQSQREIFEKIKFQTPGPGQYRLPSEFGYYENIRNISVPEASKNRKK